MTSSMVVWRPATVNVLIPEVYRGVFEKPLSIYLVICQRFHLSQAYTNGIKSLKAERCFSVKQEGLGLESQLGQDLSVWSLYVPPPTQTCM